jgi:hypothetical protein
MIFFFITSLTGRNSPLKTPNMSLISDNCGHYRLTFFQKMEMIKVNEL